MNTQKNAAWYRHQSWHRQTIIPALMPCSNGAWRFLPLPDRAKHKQKKARNYAGLAAFHAIRCLAVPDAESFPIYRKWINGDDEIVRELANEDDWIESDPTQVNSWFKGIVEDRNSETDGWGTQFRNLVQLLKRFCRSRKDWLDMLPNGMKLTMLVSECQPDHDSRIDLVFRNLLENIDDRLGKSKIIRNLAHPDQPMITRGDNDANVQALSDKIVEAIEEMETLDDQDNDNLGAARQVWDWIFKSDGYFKEYDESVKEMALVEGTSRLVFDVPWREVPPWPVSRPYSVTLTGKYGNSEHGSTWHTFPNNGAPLDKHLYLRFQGQTNTPKPYQIFWQVVNTGSEAINSGSLRGQIIESSSVGAGGLQSTSAPGPFRRERTLYTGMHWVECFVVKGGVCVARSGPFVVNIK